MTYRFVIQSLGNKWHIVDTKLGTPVKRKPFKTLRGAANRAIKLNQREELCRTK